MYPHSYSENGNTGRRPSDLDLNGTSPSTSILENTSPSPLLQSTIRIDTSNPKHVSLQTAQHSQELISIIDQFQVHVCESWIPFFDALHQSLCNGTTNIEPNGPNELVDLTLSTILSAPKWTALFQDYQSILKYIVSIQSQCRTTLVLMQSKMVPNHDGSIVDPCEVIFVEIKNITGIMLSIQNRYVDMLKDVNDIKSEKIVLLDPLWTFNKQHLLIYCNECLLGLHRLNNLVHRTKPFIESTYKNIMRAYMNTLKNLDKHEKMYM